MKENSAHGFTEGSEVPKEQDAAHSFDKRVDAICEVCKFNDAIHYDNNKYFCCGCFAKELTRLRSELHQERARVAELKKEIERLTPIEFSNHNTDG